MNSPASRKLLVVALAAVLSGFPCASECLGWSLASQPVEGVLLLKNSNIIRGKIQQQGKHYHVYLPNGKLRIREQQVETVCQDLEAAFQYRVEKFAGSSADSHLDLAGWCLRHELYQHAEAELAAAAKLDDRHPRLPMLRRQLEQSMKMAEHQKQHALEQARVPPEPKPLDPTALDKAPRWARALFVRQIQPLMVHSCATGGCHQPGEETTFQLSRLAIDGVGHPGVTLRNLAATLEQIDWDASDESTLLSRARKAHGGENASQPLPPHKLRVLQSWVDQLAEAHQQESQLQQLPVVAAIEVKPEVVEITPTLELNAPQLAAKTPPVGVRTASYQAKDPFDPGVFNERFATVKPPAPLPTVQATTLTESSVPHVLAPSDPTPIPLPLPAAE